MWRTAKAAALVSVVAAISSAPLGSAQTTLPAAAPATMPGAATVGRNGRAAPAADLPVESAVTPIIHSNEQPRHKAFLERAKQGNIDIVFLGDSITDFFANSTGNTPPGGVPNNGVAVWNKYWVPLNAVCFGISGARTQGLLGRIDDGELDGYKAKCIILMIGTNNLSTNRNTNEETLAGLKLVVADIRKHQPDTRLLIMGILPRGTRNDRVKLINAEMATWADNQHIFFMDIFNLFMNPDGTQKKEIMNGTIHLNEKGYQVWTDAIIEKVKELLAAQ
jgi:N-acetylglucosamine-6-sulfatase